MARGRAFDSDASGSGSRGGRGLGHNTRGRGGTILCSAASTAANTSFYPFLFYPTFWTSSVFTSCTVTYSSSDPRNSLSLVAGHIYPASRASRQIMRIIKLHLHKERYTWDVVPQEARDFYWEEFQENYTTTHERLVSSQAKSEVESRIDEVTLYLEAVGGEKKRKAYGIGSQASQFYCGSASHAATASARPQPEHSAEEFTALRARVDEQERQLAELRAYVMRLSGQPGAGTSSSDPTPATDRNVSTSQQQHYHLLIPMLQTIPWSPLPTLQHIQQVLLPTI
ncbi:hypothetical protein JCGZ_10985 [Jatropha curcas]|uniref:Uncharacterized protein n=1 Tax=Jatropha curcas TaxID=180498 RepID=A0A067KU20_JATCU|nr:hypothetical protein JCGZ_10985 [Jatropha curcas]